MGDVHFGYVYDFGSGEEWSATRGGGAWLGETRLGESRPLIRSRSSPSRQLLPELSLTRQSRSGFAGGCGSWAPRLSLCHLAAGRVDAVCSLKESARCGYRRFAASAPRVLAADCLR